VPAVRREEAGVTRLIECVPNFSEGRNRDTITSIAAAIEAVDGAALLDVDAGAGTNRTVMTIVGPPEAVVEAAFAAAATATDLIDMRVHHGEHPRFGALDVCPLVPISGVTMDETIAYARALAQRLGDELGLTVYCYEHAATGEGRRNLAAVRAGEYEGLEAKLSDPAWQPDFGPARFDPRSGATAVGARNFLVAYNVNLNTTSTRRANAIAFDVREKGRIRREPPVTGDIVRDEHGEPVWTPGSLKHVKAIGWYLEDYGIAQASMNLPNIAETPVHRAFEECRDKARARGVRVTGSEIVGLIPLEAMLAAGRHYLRLQKRSTGVGEAELVKIAVRSMGLDELSPFDPDCKIIEYAIRDRSVARLAGRPLEAFVGATASESPAPGGGSVSAAVGALGAALGAMVANLSAHKRGWDDRWEEFSQLAERAVAVSATLLRLVDEDTEAFNRLVDAWKADPAGRAAAVEAATKAAIDVPLEVMDAALASMDVLSAVAASGLADAVSDAGVGALCARAAVRGASLNVRINAANLTDRAVAAASTAKADELEAAAARREEAILAVVAGRIGGEPAH
jgi:glutamate formiminotransferase/formiminotetrahydrofolate cyclodeaminase